MALYKEGLIERGSGRLLRYLALYFFLAGLAFIVGAIIYLDGTLLLGVVFVIPYVVVRIRDRRGRWEERYKQSETT